MKRIAAVSKLARISFVATLVFEMTVGACTVHSQQVGFALGSPETALTLCRQADRLSGSEREGTLQRGLEVAEAAVAADPDDAKAHFAVFCNLGKQLQSQLPGLTAVKDISRLRRELDTALTLAPGDPDLLVAKGALLLALPWVLGGDVRQGEELLRAILVKDPDNGVARGYLSR